MKITTLLLLCCALLNGCSTVFKAQNEPIAAGNYGKGKNLNEKYTSEAFNQTHKFGENVVILAFSGGGTRAAALSYGVLQELENTRIRSQSSGKEQTLLDDVDFISSVSGGSFTAAYYGAFGKQIFKDYESKFLRQSNESVLISKMLSPSYWIKSLTSVFDRTELAIEYYDKHIFERKTFGDIPKEDRPFIVINATDLSLGQRFSFEQESFDLICSELSSFPLARAVTASSAVPILFPSVVLENYSAKCPTQRFEKEILSSDEALEVSTQERKDFIHKIRTYRDSKKKRYVHLVDGGLSDNLGLRAISDKLEIFGLERNPSQQKPVKRVYILLVNSSVVPEREMDTSATSVSLSETLDAFTEALIQNRSSDTKGYFFDSENEFERVIKASDPNIEIYTTEITFESLESEEEQRFFNRLPTSLELEDAQIDQVIEAGRRLLRKDEDFQRFLSDQKRP